MIKTMFTTLVYVAGTVVAGATIWKIVKHQQTPRTYDSILSKSINMSMTLLRKNSSNGGVTANVLILKRIREGQVAFCLIRRYESGRTTSTTISSTFDIGMCPLEVRNNLESKNEVIIQKIELS